MTTLPSAKPLKSGNIVWISGLALLDIALLLIVVFPEAVTGASMSRLVAGRMALMAVLPVMVLILSSLVPPATKATLVYFRLNYTLPGHRAFTKHAPDDSRIDMDLLKKNVGALPTDPREQNSTWYKLYKKVEADGAVVDAHKSYLLFRDMASMSALLSIAVPIALYLADISGRSVGQVFALFAIQYLLTALAAAQSGIRFVKNVLAIHAVRKVTIPRP